MRGTLSLDEWVSESLGGKNIFVQMLSGHSAPDELSLEIAKANLRHHFSAVGLCENMSEFLLRLCAKSGLKLPFYSQTNITSGSPRTTGQLSEKARQTFIEDNQLDYGIFEHARLRSRAMHTGPAACSIRRCNWSKRSRPRLIGSRIRIFTVQ